MSLLALQDVSIAFGGPPVLDHASFAIEPGERVCLLGRNGAGKSTLLRVVAGTVAPDAGEVVRASGLVVTMLEQDVPAGVDGTIFDVVAAGLGERGRLIAEYHAASLRVAAHADDRALRELDRLHHALDRAEAWTVNTRVETVLQHLGLEPDAPFADASGGRKRQTLLARALVRAPDVLLLDEPTNHLDIEAIEWLEEYLREQRMALLFVTHDRAFLRRVATRIVELDRGRLVSWSGGYDDYLRLKDAALASEAKEWEAFDKRLAKEEVWIRTGIQARRTRNEGRVRALEAMRRERRERRERAGTARLQAQEADRSGRLVIEARALTFSRGDRAIVRDASITIMRGDRVGIVGPNGSGKTTLLRLLLGELTPDAGTVRHGTNLEVVYFDELRETLDPDRTVFDAIADGAEFVTIEGERRHVHGYLQDFLFPPERARTPVRALSGGERNRLLLARLFTRRFNVLVLDEPTNDLDMETLDLLEELLLGYSGTLLLVSHDRDFLDAVVTSTLVMEPAGRVGEYAGSYSDWVRQRKVDAPPPPTVVRSKPEAAAPVRERKRKLSFREAKELADLPDRIDALEQERAALYARLADPAVLRDGAAVAAARSRLAALEAEIPAAMARWEELELLGAASPS